MRDLIRKGVKTVGVDCVLSHEGFRSIYGKSYACPDPDTHPEDWVDFMKSFSRQMGTKPVVIAAADQFVSAIGHHADELADHYIFSRATVAVQAALASKEQQYALVRAHGFPCPRTEYVQSDRELLEFTSTAQFPCLLKPRHEREWEGLPEGNPMRGRKIIVAQTSEEMLEYYRSVKPHRPEIIAQEIIAGPDTAKYCYLSVYGNDRSRLGYCVVQELRTAPIFFGSACLVTPVVDHEIARLCDEFLRSIDYVGLCEIELKRDVRDDRVRLIEVNPRFSGTGDCSIYAGVEVGWLHYLDLIGQPVSPVEPSRLDFRHFVLRREAVAVPEYFRAGLLTWRELFGSYRGRKEFFDFDLRDWRVTASTLWYCVRLFLVAILRRLGLRPQA